jgi:hypothetical protein
MAGGLPRAGWQKVLTDIGFTEVAVGEPVDTFGGAAGGEERPGLRGLRLPLPRPETALTGPS